jgi:hypothetical protein
MYIRLHPTRQPPNSMNQLLEGVAPAGRTQKVMVLRASAARDPLSTSGEWRTVKPNDPAFLRFVRDITEYANGRTPNPTSDPALQGIPLPRLTGLVIGLDSDRGDESGEDNSMSSNGPFIGVASRSRRDSVVTYYGIDHHDGWIFTPFYRW